MYEDSTMLAMYVNPAHLTTPAWPTSSRLSSSSSLCERRAVSRIAPPPSAKPTVASISRSSVSRGSTPTLQPGRRYKRASWACKRCAQRRVRCDAFAQVPCKRCREDDVCCIVPQKKPPQNNQTQTQTQTLTLTPDAQDHDVVNHAWPKSPQRPVHSISSYPSSNVSHTELISPYPSKRNSPHSLQTQSGLSLAAFIKPLPDSIGWDDMCYLQQKGALALPEPSLQHALLLAYTKFVHPLLPVLELHDFFSALHLPRCGRGNMSIFLYKAVLFAASSFVDEGRFSQSGLFSRVEVSRKLFHDARLLYEFGSETDTVVLIQGLLLMTLRLDPEDGPKDASHWNGIALSLIEKLLLPMGISPEPPSACCGNSPWKRLWYCCYTRDQHIAMSLHPPLRLKKRPPCMSDLSEQDFCIKPLEVPESMGLVHQDFQLFTVQAQEEMVRIFIQRTRLSHLTGQALNVRYTTQRRPSISDFDTLTSNMVFAPQDHSGSSAAQLETNLKLCELREHWLDSKLIPSPQQDETILDISVLNLHQNYLYIFLEMTILLLYEPEALTLENYQTAEEVQVHKSCRRILQRIAYLHSRGVVNLLPLEILTALQPALTSYLVKKTENVASTAPVSEVHFLQCIQALDALGHIHGGVARDAVQYIDNLYNSTSPTITDEALPDESESFLMDLLGKHGFDF